MKTFLKTLGLAALLALAFATGLARAQDERQNADTTGASFQNFYDQLADQGTWIQTDKYGYVFQPRVNDPNWRPYSYGHWVDTDAGMAWVSDEPFGWATYHYGRWVDLDDYGWVWVPGYTWAPAWVSWRESDDYIGWAPLPPDTLVGVDFFNPGISIGFGFHFGNDCDDVFGIGPAWFNFCPVAFFGDPFCWRHFCDRDDNFVIINRTRNITNININNRTARVFDRVRANGPSLATVNARSLTPVQRARLAVASSPANAGLRGNTLAAFAPNVDPATVKTARPGSVSATLANARENRGTRIDKPLTVAPGIKAASPTVEQIHAATLAQSNVPVAAKIAKANGEPSRALTRPLTALQPNANMGGARSTLSVGGGVKPSAAGGANGGGASTATGGASHRATAPSNAESAFTGIPITRGSVVVPSRSAESAFTGAPTTRRTVTPSSSGESIYHPQANAPVYHPSAPAYHPQSSFRSFAPATQPHFNGGNFGSGAPAAHFSGGNVGGGDRSYSGGARTSSGRGQYGNGQRH